MTFYNTTSEQGAELARYEIKAESQEHLILAFFQRHRRAALRPDQVLEAIWHSHPLPPPLTSIRRAMTNLTYDGYLEKMDTKERGCYGRPMHLWRLRPKETQLELLP